jgi:diguanylate cyclase (GGDEF)-like protein
MHCRSVLRSLCLTIAVDTSIATGMPVLVAISYFLADLLLNKIALGDGWQIFWPLNGVTIALLIIRPRRDWLRLLAAVSLGTGLGEYLDNNPLGTTLVQRGLSVLEVVVSASFLPAFTRLDTWLRTPGLYPRFAAAVLVGPGVTGVLAACYFHAAQGQPYLASLDAWAVADAMGIAATLPLVLAVWSSEGRALLSLDNIASTAATLLAATIVMAGIFTISRYPLIFVLYPLLMLVDWRLGLLGSSACLWCACVLAVFLTEHGYGPFTNPATLGFSRELALQFYLGFHLLGFLPISILFLERRWMEGELRGSLARAATLAALDGLTGLANRRALDQYLDEQWRRGLRQGTPLALLMIDVDHFKQFNDRLGHQAGDECLRAIAAAIRGCVTRPADAVARFGGEEFTVVLPETALGGAQDVAERVRAAVFALSIAHPGDDLPEGRRVTVSVGCAALVPQLQSQCSNLVALADQALYLAKGAGRNCIRAADAPPENWSSGTATRKLRARIETLRRRYPRDRSA